VRVAIEQKDIADMRSRLRGVELRFVSQPDRVYMGSVAREVPGATKSLPSAALTRAGGGNLANDPSASQPNVAFDEVFLLDVKIEALEAYPLGGERVYARFDLGYASMLTQVYSDIRQLWLRLTDV
jgi:putative peptide zinc metalloprotease protein